MLCKHLGSKDIAILATEQSYHYPWSQLIAVFQINYCSRESVLYPC